jgi:DNA-binding Lrp family transcriptional regulator
MVSAFVMVNVSPGEETSVRDELRAVEGVEEVHVVYGIYDIVAKIEAAGIGEIKDVVTETVRTLPDVRSTLTMIVVEE